MGIGNDGLDAKGGNVPTLEKKNRVVFDGPLDVLRMSKNASQGGSHLDKLGNIVRGERRFMLFFGTGGDQLDKTIGRLRSGIFKSVFLELAGNVLFHDGPVTKPV